MGGMLSKPTHENPIAQVHAEIELKCPQSKCQLYFVQVSIKIFLYFLSQMFDFIKKLLILYKKFKLIKILFFKILRKELIHLQKIVLMLLHHLIILKKEQNSLIQY